MKIESYLRFMAEKGASDLYMTTGARLSMKLNGEMVPISEKPLKPGVTKAVAWELMTPEQQAEFEKNLEMNIGLPIHDVGRFRVNIYYQRGEVSLVIRYVSSNIRSLEALSMPLVLQDQVMQKSGLVLVVGATGTGKSTTLAAMIEHRNRNMAGHILTIEDPIEFAFSHAKSIVGQREVGIDTLSYENALREAMREAPDVIMVGEIRDHETMEAALSFADTGHLVLSTLHAVNANQALDRIVGLFPEDARGRVLQDLSLNLRCIASQRLVMGLDGQRVPAVEILINTPFIAELIYKGQVGDIKEVMEKSSSVGMQTFDQSLLSLWQEGKISREEALANADSRNNLEWRMNFGGGVSDPTTETPALQDIVYTGLDKTQKPRSAAAPQEMSSPLDDLKPLSETAITGRKRS